MPKPPYRLNTESPEAYIARRTPKPKPKLKPDPVDIVVDIIRYESGEMTETETIEFFQRLVDSGTIRHLQGHYQRTASALLSAGYIVSPHKGG